MDDEKKLASMTDKKQQSEEIAKKLTVWFKKMGVEDYVYDLITEPLAARFLKDDSEMSEHEILTTIIIRCGQRTQKLVKDGLQKEPLGNERRKSPGVKDDKRQFKRSEEVEEEEEEEEEEFKSRHQMGEIAERGEEQRVEQRKRKFKRREEEEEEEEEDEFERIRSSESLSKKREEEDNPYMQEEEQLEVLGGESEEDERMDPLDEPVEKDKQMSGDSGDFLDSECDEAVLANYAKNEDADSSFYEPDPEIDDRGDLSRAFKSGNLVNYTMNQQHQPSPGKIHQKKGRRAGQEVTEIPDNESEKNLREYTNLHPGRRKSIVGDCLKENKVRHYVPPVIEKDSTEKKALRDNMRRCVMLRDLSSSELDMIVDAMEYHEYKKNDVLFKEGGVALRFFVLTEGICIGIKEAVTKQKFFPVDCFGELALIHDTPRRFTMYAASEKVKTYSIGRLVYRRIVMKVTLHKRTLYTAFIKNVPLFEGMNMYEIERLIDALEPLYNFQKGTVILREGYDGDGFYMIETGEVEVTKRVKGKEGEEPKSMKVGTLKAGDYFGELALLYDQPRKATVTSLCDDLVVLRVGKQTFYNLLGPCQEIMKRNEASYASFFKRIEEEQNGKKKKKMKKKKKKKKKSPPKKEKTKK